MGGEGPKGGGNSGEPIDPGTQPATTRAVHCLPSPFQRAGLFPSPPHALRRGQRRPLGWDPHAPGTRPPAVGSTHLLVESDRHVRGGRHRPPDGRHIRRVVELALGGVPVEFLGRAVCERVASASPSAERSAHMRFTRPPLPLVRPNGRPRRPLRALRGVCTDTKVPVPPFLAPGGARGRCQFGRR